jgi:hypothetical protein
VPHKNPSGTFISDIFESDKYSFTGFAFSIGLRQATANNKNNGSTNNIFFIGIVYLITYTIKEPITAASILTHKNLNIN